MREFRSTARRALVVMSALWVAAAALPALGQEPEPVNLDAAIGLLRTDLRAQKKAIITSNLPLSADQATDFWSLYQDYENDMGKLNDERFLLFKDYANNYSGVDDLTAEDMARRSADLDERRGALRLKYVKKFARILPGRQLARFVQLDSRIDLVLSLQIAEQIPLVK